MSKQEEIRDAVEIVNNVSDSYKAGDELVLRVDIDDRMAVLCEDDDRYSCACVVSYRVDTTAWVGDYEADDMPEPMDPAQVVETLQETKYQRLLLAVCECHAEDDDADDELSDALLDLGNVYFSRCSIPDDGTINDVLVD